MSVCVLVQDLPARDVFVGLYSTTEKAIKQAGVTAGSEPTSVKRIGGSTYIECNEQKFKAFPAVVQ